MGGKVFTVAEIRDISVPIARKYGVSKLALFGSYANGGANKYSDVDFLVDASGVPALEFIGFIEELEEALGVHADVMEYRALEDPINKKYFNADERVVFYE